jgi:hypothetical protein
MFAVPAITIDDAVLTGNSVEETVPLWEADTVYTTQSQVRSDITHRLYASVIGKASTVVILNGTPGWIALAGHGYAAGTPVIFTTTGTLPSGLTAGATYYVVNPEADGFRIASSVGGEPINLALPQSGTHTATFSPNKGNPLTDTTKWVDVGPTNPWAAFDYYRNTITTAEDEIAWEFTTTGRVNSISLLGLSNVLQVSVVATAAGTEVYNRTFDLNTSEDVTGWWSYFFTPITTAAELFVSDLPPYRNMVLTVTLTGTGTISCGTCSLGTQVYLGEVTYGASVTAIDYGYQAFDKFGNYEYVKGGFALQNEYSLFIPKSMVSKVVRIIKDLRGKPCVWIGTTEYGATYNFGPYSDFNLVIAYPNHSTYSLTIKGLP